MLYIEMMRNRLLIQAAATQWLQFHQCKSNYRPCFSLILDPTELRIDARLAGV